MKFLFFCKSLKKLKNVLTLIRGDFMNELVFKEKWLIMCGKEYRIRSVADEIAVLKKQKRIAVYQKD